MTHAKRPWGRREFLEVATLSSTALLLASPYARGKIAAGSSTSVDASPAHTALHSLAPGDVKPEGWLRVYLQKQADQLGGHLPEVSWPFTGAYWSGEEDPPNHNPEGWWPWEQKGYWLDGALRCALTLQDPALLKAPLAAVDYTLNHVNPDGYLGPGFARYAKAEDRAFDNFRWPHTVFFRALAAHGEATRDARVAAAMRRHYLADRYRAPYGGPSRDVTNIEGMLWAYNRTGDRELLVMAEKAWNEFLTSAPPGDRESGDLHPDRVFANTPIHAHGVTYIEKAKLPAILYMHTGKAEYLRFALAAQERIFSHHMLIDGIPSTTEDYQQTTSQDAHETCDISDHTWSWGYLLMATGDGLWADRIERACFNAGFGAIRKDWKGVQYFSCPNQVIATDNSSHVPFVEGARGWMAYRPNPGREVACCGGNVHRFLPNYAIRMWMRDGKGGLAATLYGASTVRAHVGAGREPIEIVQETNYPFEEEIHFTIRSPKPVTFSLSLRIPRWCKAPELHVNDRPVKVAPVARGFVRLERTFHPGDRLTLKLPMHPVLTSWPDGGIGLEHGPLVYALPIKEEWTAVVTPKWSTGEFPEWNAMPAVAWNFGLGVDETNLPGEVRLERKPMTEDPWLEPPVSLVVPLRKIPGWVLEADPKLPSRMRTPALPRTPGALARENAKSTELGRVALVPYGSTQLRVTIFPVAAA